MKTDALHGQSIRAAAILLLGVTILPTLGATTYCEQTFTFHGWQEIDGKAVLWIEEDVGGECQFSQVHRVEIDDDTVSVRRRDIDGFAGIPSRVYQAFAEGPDGQWMLPSYDLTITPPGPHPELIETWRDTVVHQGAGGAKRFNAIMGREGVDVPGVSGAQGRLLHSDSSGLYVDYQISDAFVLPEAQLLLVFTEQPRRAVGMDTMHGFLIFRGSLAPYPTFPSSWVFSRLSRRYILMSVSGIQVLWVYVTRTVMNSW